jgi:hypothetical protein
MPRVGIEPKFPAFGRAKPWLWARWQFDRLSRLKFRREGTGRGLTEETAAGCEILRAVVMKTKSLVGELH